MAVSIKVNGRRYEIDADPDTPLLWVLRDNLGLTGTKFGCGIAACGACTVHINGAARPSCVTALKDVRHADITTIEGLAVDPDHPLLRAWVAEDVPQCGYCQPGMIMAAAALLNGNRQPSDRDIDRAIANICRCGTYNQIRSAIHRAAKA